MKKIMCMLAVLLLITGCGNKNSAETEEKEEKIILHFTGDVYDRDIEIEKGSIPGSGISMELECKSIPEGEVLDYFVFKDEDGNTFNPSVPVEEGHTITVESVTKLSENTEKKEILPESLELNKLTKEQNQYILYLRVGEYYTFKPSIKPINSTNKKVTYSCDDNGVLKITDDAEIRALESGSANVYISTVNGIQVTVEVFVYDTTITLETVSEGAGGSAEYHYGDVIALKGTYTKYTDNAVFNFTGIPRDAKLMIIEGPNILSYEDGNVTVTGNPSESTYIKFRLIIDNENVCGVSNSVNVKVGHK